MIQLTDKKLIIRNNVFLSATENPEELFPQIIIDKSSSITAEITHNVFIGGKKGYLFRKMLLEYRFWTKLKYCYQYLKLK